MIISLLENNPFLLIIFVYVHWIFFSTSSFQSFTTAIFFSLLRVSKSMIYFLLFFLIGFYTFLFISVRLLQSLFFFFFLSVSTLIIFVFFFFFLIKFYTSLSWSRSFTISNFVQLLRSFNIIDNLLPFFFLINFHNFFSLSRSFLQSRSFYNLSRVPTAPFH